MSSQRGFFTPGDPGTPQIPVNPESGRNPEKKKPFQRRIGKKAIDVRQSLR